VNLQLRKRFKMALAGAVARGLRRPKLTAAELRNLAPRRILIVRQHNQMGDMVCATPALRAIRQTFPQAELALVCAPLNWEVVRNNPDLDQVLLFDKKTWTRPTRFWRFMRRLRSFRPDVAFVLNSVSFSLTSAGLAVFAAPVIVGGDSRPFGWDISRHIYSLEMPTRPDPDRHAVHHSLAPLEAIGITTDDLSSVVVPLPDECRQAAEILSRLTSERPPWVIHPGAGKRENLWPATRFASVAVRAADEGRQLLVLQGPADREVMGKFWAAIDEQADPTARKRMIPLPLLPVGVCAALLAEADRFLCNDTGLMHVAGAMSVPTLALFGPTDPRIWKPLSDRVVSLRGEGGKIASLDVAEVWRVLSRLAIPQAGSS
jgi:ADP-heptose:LPS heptosyltransferase